MSEPNSSEPLDDAFRPTAGRFLICGMPRSGTTLLAEYLNRVPDVVVGPETHLLQGLAPSWWERPMDETALARLLDDLIDFPPSKVGSDQIERARTQLSTGIAPLDPVAALFWLASAADPQSGVVGEKTPSHLVHAERALRLDQHLRVVVIIRDPRDVHRSLSAMPWNAGSGLVNGTRWRRYAQIALRLQHGWPDRVRIVRFEDFVDDAVGQTDELQRFLVGYVRPLGEARPTFAVEDEPWKANALLDATPDAALRWKTSPTAEDVRVAAYAGKVLSAFDYDDSGAGFGVRVACGLARFALAVRHRLSSARRGARGDQALTYGLSPQ